MTPDSEREGSERGFFFFGMEGNIEDAQSVCLHPHGLLHSAQQLNVKGDKSGAWRPDRFSKVYTGTAIGVRSKERVNRTLMTRTGADHRG